MDKKSLSKFLSKIFLGELSRTAIVAIFAAINIPTLLLLGLGKLKVILKELFQKPIEEWQILIWLFLISLFLGYTFLLFIASIKLYKNKIKKRTYILFDYKNYEWKMLLPSRELESGIPNCLRHGVRLSVFQGNKYKCPYCDVSISTKDYNTIASEAIPIGKAILDGHYKK